jgi:hypothetical protein
VRDIRQNNNTGMFSILVLLHCCLPLLLVVREIGVGEAEQTEVNIHIQTSVNSFLSTVGVGIEPTTTTSPPVRMEADTDQLVAFIPPVLDVPAFDSDVLGDPLLRDED